MSNTHTFFIEEGEKFKVKETPLQNAKVCHLVFDKILFGNSVMRTL